MRIILAILLLIAALIFGLARPLHMPQTPAMIFAVVALAGAVWVVLLGYRSSPTDERERLHRAVSFEWAMLAGAVVLAAGAIIQIINHELDPWLVYAAVAMAGARLVSYFYLDNHN